LEGDRHGIGSLYIFESSVGMVHTMRPSQCSVVQHVAALCGVYS